MREHLRVFTAAAIRFAVLFAVIGAGLHPFLIARANDSIDFALSTQDVFPPSRSDLGFPTDPQSLLVVQASAGDEAAEAWKKAVPPVVDFDWVQTTSGEWLKGTLKVMYSESLEFDSDQFGLEIIDWEDVVQLRGHGEKRLSIDTPEGPVTVVGVMTVTEDKVIVETADGVREFDRSKLISITPGATSEWDNWSFKIMFGLGFVEGNTEQTDYTAKVNIRRRTPENRYVLDYLGNYSRSSGQDTVNNQRLGTFFDMFLAREYFFRPIFFEYFRDPFQNIDYRMTVGIGGGYTIIDTPKTNWDVSGGPAYRTTRFESVPAGESQEVSTPALVLGTTYDTKLTDTLDFVGTYNLSIVNEESGKYTHHAIATFSVELTEILDFDISFVWDRTENPQQRADGTTPEQDDFQLLLTFGVDI